MQEKTMSYFDTSFDRLLNYFEDSRNHVLDVLQDDLDKSKKERLLNKGRQDIEMEAIELQLALERERRLMQVTRDVQTHFDYPEALAKQLLQRLIEKGYITKEMREEVRKDIQNEKEQLKREMLHVVK
jgi:hypothetical protein